MSVRELLAGAGFAAMLLCAGTADATLIDLGGYTGPIQFKFQNYESFSSTVLAPGVTNFGVVGVTSITNPMTNTVLWSQGKGGQYLSAVFNGITITSVTPTTGGFTTTNSGGTFQLWLTGANFDPAQGTGGYAAAGVGCVVGGLCYNGITNTGGTDLINFNLVPGTTSDPTNTQNATVSSTTMPISGHAEGFADITGGADAAEFGRGGFSTFFAPADLHFLDDFCANGQSGCVGPTTSNWENFSHDPLDAVSVAVIPGPATLSLFAGALIGLGALGRRRRVMNG